MSTKPKSETIVSLLTPRQAEVHSYLCERWADTPTVREIAEHLGGVGANAVMQHLKQLKKKGYIAMPEGHRARGITLLIGPDLSGSEIEIAGRVYRLVSTECE